MWPRWETPAVERRPSRASGRSPFGPRLDRVVSNSRETYPEGRHWLLAAAVGGDPAKCRAAGGVEVVATPDDRQPLLEARGDGLSDASTVWPHSGQQPSRTAPRRT